MKKQIIPSENNVSIINYQLIFIFWVTVFNPFNLSFAQNNALVLNGAYMILDGGTPATNIYLVVDQSNPLGIVRLGGGHINSEGQYNIVKWNAGTSTGAYTFPFGVGANAADYIPFTFNKTTAASSDISMSTWTTNAQNMPHPSVSNVAAVSNMIGVPDSVQNAIDRFWDIQSSASVTADLTFSYRGSENTTLVPSDPFKAQHWNGTSWDPQTGTGNAGVTTGIGTVGPVLAQTTFSPWTLTRAKLNITINSSQNLVCNSQCNGTATVAASGGTAPYSYLWNPSSQTIQTATGLCAGTYSVLVTDVNSSTAIDTVTITQPSAMTSSVTPTNLTCNAQCIGTATLTATGGTPGYSYSWTTSPAQTTTNITGLCAGNYTCTITDANNCVRKDSVKIIEPTAISVSVNSSPASCTSNTGSATANVSGGTGSYTYLWNPSSQTTSAATNLSSGTYTINVTDANGCAQTQTVSVSSVNTLLASTNSTPAACSSSTGSATVTASGGTGGYTYLWNPSSQTTSSVSSLSTGTYTVIVTDANNCTQTQTVSVASVNTLVVSATSTPAGCTTNIGTATANPSNGTAPYTYGWNNGQITQTATGLASGNYTATVTDANGCSQIKVVTVSTIPGPIVTAAAAPPSIMLGNNTQLTATGSGTYSWSPATGLSCTNCANPIATPSITTNYCVFVTDVNGCIGSDCITINVEIPYYEIFIPSAFSPNSDGHNDFACVRGNCIQTLTFTIYDRWGEKVFETNDQKICWDGKYKEKLLDTNVFVYVMEATLTSGEKISKKGNISLIK